MPHEEIAVYQPDVGLNSGAAGPERGKERYPTPVVVVRVAWDREDIPEKVGGIPRQLFRARAWLTPLIKGVVVVGTVAVAQDLVFD